MLELVKFIKKNKNWRELLVKKPYSIKIKEDDNYLMFNYDMTKTNFNLNLVRECRGVILNKHTFEVVSYPFYKFGNYGESYCPKIDWNTASVLEKIDGSIISVWFDKEWHISTNGCINADDAFIRRTVFDKDEDLNSFGLLFKEACELKSLNFETLDKNNTYIFELVSPYNQIVIKYDEIDIYHIGTRNMNTLQEIEVNIGVKKPIRHKIHSLEECIEVCKGLTLKHEGFVVVDSKYNRIKVKNPQYIEAHHIRSSGVFNLASAARIILAGEKDEYLNYRPEYTKVFKELSVKINVLLDELETKATELQNTEFPTKKDYALAVKDLSCSGFYFNLLKDESLQGIDWLSEQPDKSLIRIFK